MQQKKIDITNKILHLIELISVLINILYINFFSQINLNNKPVLLLLG